MTVHHPSISVVVPLYNGGAYIRGCVESVLAQTLAPTEILLVDDGSTDGGADIAAELSSWDPRVRLLKHEGNLGAGAARNTGLSAAGGEYVLFLDADDLYEKTLLERAAAAAVADGADVVLYGADHYLEAEGRFEPAPEMLDVASLPEKRPFQAADAADRLFQLCTPEVWNKLFRRAFLEENGLRFQQLPNANDLYFSLCALALGKITAVPETLIHYRVGSGGIQAGKARAPMAFRDALAALRQELKDRGRWELLEQSFANLALFHINYNYRGMKAELSGELRSLYRDFGIAGSPRDGFVSGHEYGQYVDNIYELPDFDVCQEWAHGDFFRAAAARAMRERSEALRREEEALRRAERAEEAERERSDQLREAREEIRRIHDSATYRVGRVMTALPRSLRNFKHKE